jgi:hypothetical protein
MSAPPAAGRARLAWAAIVAGTLLALGSFALAPPRDLPAGVAAMVGEQAIGIGEWQRAITAVEGDRGAALDAAGRSALLDRLIEEELLRQHALASGLARDDPALRKALVRAVLDALQRSVEAEAADPAALRAFAAANPGYFSAQPRLALRAARGPAPAPRALLAAALCGDAVLPPGFARLPIPDGPVPATRLAGYAGARLAEAARAAPVDTLHGPVGDAWLCVRAREAPTATADEAAVREEFLRRRAESLTAALLASLREDIAIVRADAP